MKGKLIVFEGPSGAGKSTQLRLLAERLTRGGVACLAVREPGGTPAGDVIRDLVLDPEARISPSAEALLFMSSRAELVEREIKPSLEKGMMVLVDRFFLSTYAYQVVARGLDETKVRAANSLATGSLIPDLTLLLDMPVDVALDRAEIHEFGDKDRIESMGKSFQAKASAAFARFADKNWQRDHPECGPIVKIDASGNEETVFARVRETLLAAFPSEFGVLKQ